MTVDLRPIQLGHRHFIAAHERELLGALNESREFGIKYTQQFPTFTPRSGTEGLAYATTGAVLRTSRGAVVKFTNPKKYAAAIDGGARAHTIRAHGRVLAFRGRDGNMVFRKSVNHPGNRPYRFLYRATNAAGRIFQQSMLLRMQRITASFGR